MRLVAGPLIGDLVMGNGWWLMTKSYQTQGDTSLGFIFGSLFFLLLFLLFF